MRVSEYEFRIPFIKRLHLLGAPEPNEVLLETDSYGGSYVLLLYADRKPVLLTQTGHDLSRGDECVPLTEALHRRGSEDAWSLKPEILVGECLGFEVGGYSVWDHGPFFHYRSPVYPVPLVVCAWSPSRCGLFSDSMRPLYAVNSG